MAVFFIMFWFLVFGFCLGKISSTATTLRATFTPSSEKFTFFQEKFTPPSTLDNQRIRPNHGGFIQFWFSRRSKGRRVFCGLAQLVLDTPAYPDNKYRQCSVPSPADPTHTRQEAYGRTAQQGALRFYRGLLRR